MIEQMRSGIVAGFERGDSLVEIISNLRNTVSPSSLLSSLLADRTGLLSLAQRSYSHPNGFFKLVLIESGHLDFQLRVHVWPRRTEAAEPGRDIHNHRWSYASWVLDGTFRQENFAVDGEDGIGLYHYLWRSDCGLNGPVGGDKRVRVAVKSERDLNSGEIYELAAGQLHRFTPVDGGCSLVLQGPSTIEYADIYTAAPFDYSKTDRRRALSLDEIVPVLKMALRSGGESAKDGAQ